MNTQAEGKVPMVHAFSLLHSARDGGCLDMGPSLEGHRCPATLLPHSCPAQCMAVALTTTTGTLGMPTHLHKHLVGSMQSAHFMEEDAEFRGRWVCQGQGAFMAELSLNSCWSSSPACTLSNHTGARPSDHPVVTRSLQLWTPALESSPNAGAAWTPTQPGQPLRPPVVTSEDRPAGRTWLSNRAWRAPSSPTECPCRTGSRDKDDKWDLPLEKLGVYI